MTSSARRFEFPVTAAKIRRPGYICTESLWWNWVQWTIDRKCLHQTNGQDMLCSTGNHSWELNWTLWFSKPDKWITLTDIYIERGSKGCCCRHIWIYIHKTKFQKNVGENLLLDCGPNWRFGDLWTVAQSEVLLTFASNWSTSLRCLFKSYQGTVSTWKDNKCLGVNLLQTYERVAYIYSTLAHEILKLLDTGCWYSMKWQ